MNVPELYAGNYAQEYNTLPSIEDAYARLQALADADAVIRELLALTVSRDGRHPEAGVFLLHRHFECPVDKIMLEERTLDVDETPMWITAARTLTPGVRAVPSRLAFDVVDPARLRPLEYSTAPDVCSAYDRVTANAQLLADLRKILIARELTDLLGLVIGPAVLDDRVLLEATDPQEDRSVVKLFRRDDVSPSSIPTTWVRRDAAADGCCTVVGGCQSYCMRPGDELHRPGHLAKGPKKHLSCT